jgi:hypothetical protein
VNSIPPDEELELDAARELDAAGDDAGPGPGPVSGEPPALLDAPPSDELLVAALAPLPVAALVLSPNSFSPSPTPHETSGTSKSTTARRSPTQAETKRTEASCIVTSGRPRAANRASHDAVTLQSARSGASRTRAAASAESAAVADSSLHAGAHCSSKIVMTP